MFSVLMKIRAFHQPDLLLFVSYNPILSQQEAEDSFTWMEPDPGWIRILSENQM